MYIQIPTYPDCSFLRKAQYGPTTKACFKIFLKRHRFWSATIPLFLTLKCCIKLVDPCDFYFRFLRLCPPCMSARRNAIINISRQNLPAYTSSSCLSYFSPKLLSRAFFILLVSFVLRLNLMCTLFIKAYCCVGTYFLCVHTLLITGRCYF